MSSHDFVPLAPYQTFNSFMDSEKSGAIVLMACTVMCLFIANSSFGPAHLDFWQLRVAGWSLEDWANDAKMAILVACVSAGLLGMSWLTLMTPHARNGDPPA